MNPIRTLLTALLLVSFEANATTPLADKVACPAIGDARVQELQKLRFGMFICWSFSTFSGTEYTPGKTNVNFFRATECDTEQWARTAKEAGMQVRGVRN
jgi:alpha-L-fucosidase